MVTEKFFTLLEKRIEIYNRLLKKKRERLHKTSESDTELDIYEDIALLGANYMKDIERDLEIMKNSRDYETLSKSFAGETIKDFFCNGFFGGSTYDLEGAEITRIYEDEDAIVLEVKKTNKKRDYGYFSGHWEDWKTVHDFLERWTSDTV